MALIDFNVTSSPYIICQGAFTGSGSGTTALTNTATLASSVISSNGITATTSTRLTFSQGGWYEFDIPFFFGLDGGGAARSITLFYGINGSFTQLISSPAATFIFSRSILNFVLKMNSSDYFEMRTTVSGSVAAHYTAPSLNGNYDFHGSHICIKRVY